MTFEEWIRKLKDIKDDSHPEHVIWTFKDANTMISLLESYRETIEFYAHIGRWESTTHETTRDGIGCVDFSLLKLGIGEGYEQVGGKRAREALSKEPWREK